MEVDYLLDFFHHLHILFCELLINKFGLAHMRGGPIPCHFLLD